MGIELRPIRDGGGDCAWAIQEIELINQKYLCAVTVENNTGAGVKISSGNTVRRIEDSEGRLKELDMWTLLCLLCTDRKLNAR
jgi:hypothetical protein